PETLLAVEDGYYSIRDPREATLSKTAPNDPLVILGERGNVSRADVTALNYPTCARAIQPLQAIAAPHEQILGFLVGAQRDNLARLWIDCGRTDETSSLQTIGA